MPEAPQQDDQLDAGEVDGVEQPADTEEEHRRGEEAGAEAREELGVAVGPHHAGQVVSQRSEGGHVDTNLAGREALPKCEDRREHEERRGDDEGEVEARLDDPERPAMESPDGSTGGKGHGGSIPVRV